MSLVRRNPAASRRKGFLALVLLFLSASILSTACGGEDDERDAVAACERFKDTYCNKSAECAAEADEAGSNAGEFEHELCVIAFESVLTCADAYWVGPTFDQCMEDIEDSPCNEGALSAQPLLASCEKIIQ